MYVWCFLGRSSFSVFFFLLFFLEARKKPRDRFSNYKIKNGRAFLPPYKQTYMYIHLQILSIYSFVFIHIFFMQFVLLLHCYFPSFTPRMMLFFSIRITQVTFRCYYVLETIMKSFYVSMPVHTRHPLFVTS